MRDETVTQALHRLTSYEPGREWTDPVADKRIVQDLEVNDDARLPWFYKRYEPSLSRVKLPRELPSTAPSAVDVLAGTATVAPREPDLAQLARLLFLCSGVVRTADRNGTTWLFRAAGSAGARFPLEVYVAVPEGGALPSGVHWYDPEQHAIVHIGPPPEGDAPAIVVTGVPWRTGWRYRERGYRHVYWDAGTMLSQLLVAADSAGVPAHLFSRFPDADITRLVGADGVHEYPVFVVSLGDMAPTLASTGAAVDGQVDSAPVEFPLVTAAQHAGDLVGWGAEWLRGEPVDVEGRASEPVDDVILRRGTQRRMNPAGRLLRSVVSTAMTAAVRGVDVPHWVAAHAVDGVAPGLYRWPDLDAPVRRGDLREQLFRAALEQGLAGDAAFVAVSAVDVSGLDDHGYREAQLAAGLVEGRLHLLAYAQGASASGMTFQDTDIPALLGEQMDGLLFTCVGVPEYRSRPGGAPGAPTAVRVVTPRMERGRA